MPREITTTSDGEVKNSKDFRVYRIKGVDHPIIARKGGPNADRIKNDLSYEALRNNQKEFGVASMMSKVLRNSLSKNLSEICESYVSGKLTAQFRNLAKHEDGETGTRPFFLTKHGHFLSGFEFNSACPYKENFNAKYFVKEGSHRGQVIIHFPAFIPKKAFNYPKGATNFKISARLIALSDYCYDPEEKTYLPRSKDHHGKFGYYESQMLPILKIPTEPMTTMIAANENKHVSENTALFLIMAVRFFKYEDSKFKLFGKDSSMQIYQVF